MYEKLDQLKQARESIYKQSEALLQRYGVGAEGICRIRDVNQADYQKFADLAVDYRRADEAVWAERDRLYHAGVEYRQQP